MWRALSRPPSPMQELVQPLELPVVGCKQSCGLALALFASIAALPVVEEAVRRQLQELRINGTLDDTGPGTPTSYAEYFRKHEKNLKVVRVQEMITWAARFSGMQSCTRAPEEFTKPPLPMNATEKDYMDVFKWQLDAAAAAVFTTVKACDRTNV
ncbi:hypothetical protein JKP88DRAFT_245866 [Tribonema minus]|uniref:Uncharacterized protein n=1 Tax=Tribonema minus TaxID=303371 RepID=A0A835Z2N6_9STRA|nr:hypothetical protein JKP88DRAFT_245866 [Tribonema minus]